MKFSTLAAAVIALTTLSVEAAHADGRLSGWRQNGAGGVTGFNIHNHTGPNGGSVTGGRGVITNGQGAGAGGGAFCANGQQGAGCRAGTTTWNNGAVQHQGGFTAQGVNGGSITSQGGFTSNPDGSYAGNRTTEASGANGTYSGQTSYSSDGGVNHTATCTDVNGVVVACPTR